MNEVEIVDLHKSFGRQQVLSGVDLTVPKGSLTALLGPSGSGKTTLLRILAGLERVDAGTVRIGDTVVDDGRHFVPPEHRSIGYVPQEGALFPHLTVERNVGFGLQRPHRKGDRVAELLDMVGLAGLGGRFPHQLSGGQQQRVALARALAIRPRMVLLDEPFSSLDVGLRASVRADVQRVLREAGTTALLVTHDQDEALSLADRVAVIRKGHIGQCGSPQDLYDQPARPGIARFLGEVNLVDGTLLDGRVVTPLGTLDLRRPIEPVAPDGRVTVLIRPEQVDIRPSDEGPGLRGLVVRSEFHGHDTVVTLTPAEPCGTSEIVVRTDGGRTFSPGTAVNVIARGSALAWPCDRRDRRSDRPSA